MKKVDMILRGTILIVLGVVLALNALDITNIDVFFAGWWTLFIIVPCARGLLTKRNKTDNFIGLIIGVFLLLCCQDVLSFSMLWKLMIPGIIVFVGMKMVFNGLFDNKAAIILKRLRAEGRNPKTTCATFSGCDINYDGQIFEGAELNAIFGAVSCDLRNAFIDEDCAIQVSAIFGGIEILVPDGINVKVRTNSIFGGVSNNTKVYPNAPTIYISGHCMFGGMEIQ